MYFPESAVGKVGEKISVLFIKIDMVLWVFLFSAAPAAYPSTASPSSGAA